MVRAADDGSLADDEIAIRGDGVVVWCETDGHDPAQGTGGVETGAQEGNRAHHVERDVHGSVGRGHDATSQVRSALHRDGAEPRRSRELRWVDVDCDNGARPEDRRQLHGGHAEATDTEHDDMLANPELGFLEGVICGRRRAHHHRGVLDGDFVRHAVCVGCGDDDGLGVPAGPVLAEHRSIGTELLDTARAVATVATGDQVVEGDPFAVQFLAEAFTESKHRPGDLVTQRQRQRPRGREPRAVVHVRSADTGGFNGNEYLARTRVWCCDLSHLESGAGCSQLYGSHGHSRLVVFTQMVAHGPALRSPLRQWLPPMLYLDHAATTAVRPQVRETMAPYLDDVFGNPSGLHEVSRRAKNALEEARERAAHLLGADRPLEIVFTGGGTEADNLAVAGAALAGAGRGGVVTTAVEHEAVLDTAAFLERVGCTVSIVGVDRMGRVAPDAVAAAVGPGTVVVSVMSANNETGTLQPVRTVAAAAREANPDVVLHTDAVQSFLSEEVTVASTGCDLIALASHKLGGPKGVGLLYVRNGVDLEPVIHGGGQEMGRRSGTHNVAGIVGMVEAMELSVADRHAFRGRVGAARDRFEETLRAGIEGLTVNAPIGERLVQHSHVRIPGVAAETLLIRLDRAGVAAAAGSACQSGALERSHVLAAMGMGEKAASECVRFSFGWSSEPEDGDTAADRVLDVVGTLR